MTTTHLYSYATAFVFTIALTSTPLQAALIPVPNGDFENTGTRVHATGSHWSSEPDSNGIVGDLDTNDQFWTAGSGNDLWAPAGAVQTQAAAKVSTIRIGINSGIIRPTGPR
jgi:hypothetical protein